MPGVSFHGHPGPGAERGRPGAAAAGDGESSHAAGSACQRGTAARQLNTLTGQDEDAGPRGKRGAEVVRHFGYNRT